MTTYPKGPRATYAARRNLHIARGTWPGLTPAGPARDHIRSLMTAGISTRTLAHATGLGHSTINGILYNRGRRPRTTKIRADTARRILAIHPDHHSNRPAKSHTDATGTRRRLQALNTQGWTRSDLARHLGVAPTNIGRLYNAHTVHHSTAAAVRDLFDKL